LNLVFFVNGVIQTLDARRGPELLIDYLHDELDLSGTKFGCGIGVCRACTVTARILPDTAPVPLISCSTTLDMIDGAQITTIEGLRLPDRLRPIQEAFLRHFAFQCGYCTPGFVMAAQIFLDRLTDTGTLPDDLDAAIEAAVGSHICRCSGYVRYYTAIRETAENMVFKRD